MNRPPPIVLLSRRIDPAELSRLVQDGFLDMVKYVADTERGRVAIGGELHAGAELVLLEDGSRPEDLWGANYYPGRGREDCIEFTSFINIRPARENPGMEIADPRDPGERPGAPLRVDRRRGAPLRWRGTRGSRWSAGPASRPNSNF